MSFLNMCSQVGRLGKLIPAYSTLNIHKQLSSLLSYNFHYYLIIFIIILLFELLSINSSYYLIILITVLLFSLLSYYLNKKSFMRLIRRSQRYF